MNPILIIKCEIKLAASIGMILFGLFLIGVFGMVTYKTSIYWWLIGLAFGLFCVYHWSNIILKGGRTLVFYIKNQVLYFTFENTREVVQQLENIKTADFYTKAYSLEDIQNFWRYIHEVNGAVRNDILYFTYENKKETLADLGYYEVKLDEEDLMKIAKFLLSHSPTIRIGE